ncbi:AIPR family protein, partial [Mycobacterium tuberculosis]|uniref:AIPR family protein n=1 Tax=Mycobacterium tuberculosis TaxID=1773 RepID=UPI0019024A02
RYTVNTELNDCNILVTFVPLIEIAKILYKYKNSVLKYNPRCFLGLTNNQVNPQIANTVTSKHTNEFALFNNGITILSDETSINSYIAKKDSAQLVITNPQIINGGQTAFTLASLYEERKTSDDLNVFNEKEVLVKIITFLKDNKENQTDDEIKQKKIKLIENLSKATNEQSAVKEI